MADFLVLIGWIRQSGRVCTKPLRRGPAPQTVVVLRQGAGTTPEGLFADPKKTKPALGVPSAGFSAARPTV
jgi:hypothetical protein